MTRRTRRPAPHSAPIAITLAVTMAMFAPDTAVMCVSETVFIECERCSLTLLVSPIANPGMS